MRTTLYFTLILLTFVTLALIPNSFAGESDLPKQPQEQERPIVKVIYFYPNDVTPQPDIDAQLDKLVKDVQRVFSGLMEAHGFGRKTFLFEEDADGEVVVHHMEGSFNDTYYQNNSASVWDEFPESLDRLKDIYIIFLDISTGLLDGFSCGYGYYTTPYKGALIPASGGCFEGALGIDVTAHELAHGFGLAHDFRTDADAQRIYLNTDDLMITSYCAAEWFDAHPAFNTGTTTRNRNTTAIMLEPELVSPPNNIRLRFEVDDPDGIHQVKLLKPVTGDLRLQDCKGLEGVTDNTVEFVTNQLTSETYSVTLRIIDVFGNHTQRSFKFRNPLPFPPPEDLHIPDPNLAEAIRRQLGGSITTLSILDLTELEANRKGIKDLTGLEHAQNLIKLLLFHNAISDVSPLSKLKKIRWLYIGFNNISDISPLSELTQLKLLDVGGNNISNIPPMKELKHLDNLSIHNNGISDVSPLIVYKKLQKLYLHGNEISDISPLSELTQLTDVILHNNAITDVSPLAELTQLKILNLSWNRISNVKPLTELGNLKELRLHGNPIKSQKPLLELLRKNPDIRIYLKNDREPLPVTLSHFRAAHTNAGVILKWTTESEVDNAGFYIYRSETKSGEFKVVNPSMIQGAGTTGERNEYTWTDTTAKPNTVYYYRIEDVSHAGERKQLATVRLRGLVSARGKLTTRWADVKAEE